MENAEREDDFLRYAFSVGSSEASQAQSTRFASSERNPYRFSGADLVASEGDGWAATLTLVSLPG